VHRHQALSGKLSTRRGTDEVAQKKLAAEEQPFLRKKGRENGDLCGWGLEKNRKNVFEADDEENVGEGGKSPGHAVLGEGKKSKRTGRSQSRNISSKSRRGRKRESALRAPEEKKKRRS